MQANQRRAMFARINSLRTIPALNLKRNRLPVQVSVIVPSTKFDKLVPTEEFNTRISDEQKWFNEQFGGSTTIKEVGSYNLDGKVITEPGVLVESSMTVKEYKENKAKLEAHFRNRRSAWKQDSILVKVEGQSFIVPKKSYIGDDKKQGNHIIVT